MHYFVTLFSAAVILVTSFPAHAEPVTIPGIATVRATVRKAPPGWTVMQRRLIKTMEDAAPLFIDKFTYPGGTMRYEGNLLDDDYECFDKWTLLYAIGGDEKLRDYALSQFNAITRQWTYSRGKSVHKEFAKQYDALHLSEAYVGFQYFGLADPQIPENIDRAKRFAGFYLGEDPEAPNYDPEHRIITSIATGSMGPADHSGAVYVLNYGHGSLYPVVKNLEWDWAENPERRKEIEAIYDRVVTPCDTPMNLTITGLVTNAYLYTGEEKYKKWVLDYVGAWMDRIERNNGIIPDNIGRTGKIGEYRHGQWWGGFFGWSGRYSNHMIFMSLITAAECAQLVSGDSSYLDLLRSQVKVLLDNSRVENGQLLVPYKYGPDGWEDYKPLEPYILSHLWHGSMDPEDWKIIERVRAGSKFGPQPYEIKALKSPDRPKPGSEVWRPDGSILDWTQVDNNIQNTCRQHYNEAPHLLYLAGENPDWPYKILKGEFDHVNRNIGRLAIPDWSHEWPSKTRVNQNPVFTNGLAQMTMGAPWVSFNGGLLMARVRYFDLDQARPGLPPDVAALVEKLEADRAVVTLVNTNAFETRRLIIQAGAYREHEFTTAGFAEQVKLDDGTVSNRARTVPVNRDFLAVELPPATSITLDLGMKRFVNRPTFTFPWHTD